eukprot:6915123-Prymnesium_polylepis.1
MLAHDAHHPPVVGGAHARARPLPHDPGAGDAAADALAGARRDAVAAEAVQGAEQHDGARGGALRCLKSRLAEPRTACRALCALSPKGGPQSFALQLAGSVAVHSSQRPNLPSSPRLLAHPALSLRHTVLVWQDLTRNYGIVRDFRVKPQETDRMGLLVGEVNCERWADGWWWGRRERG